MHLNAYKVYHVIIVNSNTSRNVEICNIARSTINNLYIFHCTPHEGSSMSINLNWTKLFCWSRNVTMFSIDFCARDLCYEIWSFAGLLMYIWWDTYLRMVLHCQQMNVLFRPIFYSSICTVLQFNMPKCSYR